MKQKIIFTLASIFAVSGVSNAIAGAWVNPKGGSELDLGFYYSFPSTSYDRGTLAGIADVDYTAKSETRRAAATTEYTYGFTKSGTLIGLLDVGFVKDKITTTLSNNEKFTVSADYFSVYPAAGYRHKIYEDTKQVVSAQGLVGLGEFIFNDNDNIFNKKEQYVSLQLQYGRNFQSDLGMPSIFNKKRYHYIEIIGGPSYMPHLGQTEWDLEFHVGMAVDKKFTVVAGMYNSWNVGQFSRIPFDSAEIASKVNATALEAGQKAELIDILNAKSRDRSSYRDHQLDLKIEYEVSKNADIFVEGITSIIVEKPFKSNALLVGYETKF